MNEKILEKLKKLENEHDITILFAAGSGSRAWGYFNENSDYDIKFIYKCNDISQYLVLNEFNDVIQLEDGEFDFEGWDIKKALNLHFKSNPNLREWIISPVVYVPDEIGIFRDLPDFNEEILKHHYFGLAYKTNKKYILGKPMRDVKTVKKLLYVIRCSLAWQLLDKRILPPMNFSKLLELSDIDGEIKDAIFNLRDAYSQLALEKVSDAELSIIMEWVDESFGEFEKNKFKAPKRHIEEYNNRFREIIGL